MKNIFPFLIMAIITVTLGSGQASLPGAAITESHLTELPKFDVGLCINGECGIVNQNARLVMPFTPYKNENKNVLDEYFLKGHAFLLKNGRWFLLDEKSGVTSGPISSDIHPLIPGYIGYKKNGKYGVMTTAGDYIIDPQFDAINKGDKDNNYLIYAKNTKKSHTFGVLSFQWQPLTEDIYKDNIFDPNGSRESAHGELLLADRGKEGWLINIRNGLQKRVPYSFFGTEDNGYILVNDGEASTGLIDMQGNTVFDMSQYAWLGYPGVDLIAFRKDKSSGCGYMDYTGKVIIPPHFGDCGRFGKTGALVKGIKQANGSEQKYGLVGRNGSWLIEPRYDHAGRNNDNPDEVVNNAAAYIPVANDIAEGTTSTTRVYGLVNVDQGQEVITPKYAEMKVLTKDRFLFSDMQSAKNTGEASNSEDSTVGMMDIKGHILLKPNQFSHIELDDSGRFLLTTMHGFIGLSDLEGHELIAPQWHRINIDSEFSIVKAYDRDYHPEHYVPFGPDRLRAVYTFQGKPLFVIKKDKCGADQLQDGAGNPVWPLDMKTYCQK